MRPSIAPSITKTTVSDFAVWDDVTRIPGVILERRSAGEIYEQAKAQAIDPGLLQMGERGAEEAGRSQQFTARIVPVPRFGIWRRSPNSTRCRFANARRIL